MTKKNILRAAKTLFAKKGYDGTSISDLLKKTKLSKGALYHHFASKEELFVETIKFAFEDKGLKLECEQPVIKSKAQFKTHLLEEGIRLIEFQMEHPDVVALKFELMVQTKKNPSLKKYVQKLGDAKMNSLVILMQKGIDLGAFPKKTDPEMLILKFIMPLHAIGLQIAFAETDFDYVEYWKQIVGDL